MRLSFRIPTIAGLFLVILLVGTVIFFTERVLRSPSGAAASQEPQNPKITNVTDSTFTVSWTTESKTTGTILVSSPGKSNRMYYDERDTSGKLGSYTTHAVTIRDAQAKTPYSWKILSNGRSYLDKNRPYELTTPTSLPPNTSGLDPAYGTILTTQGIAAHGALVYLTLAQGQELSALTKESGLWLIPLTQVRTADFTSLLPTLERMDETIRVTHETGEITAITDSLNDSPVPEMSTGQTYDFRRQNAKTTSNSPIALRTTPSPSAGGQLPVGGSVLGSTSGEFRVSLTTPAQHASLPTAVPLFSGTGVPNKFIALSIGITQPVSGSTKVNSDGTWNFTPPKPLSAGKQSVTITTIDASGKTVAITHAFEVLKSGTQVLGNATPSGSLVSTPTATPIEVPESTLSAEEIPTSGYELPTIILVVLGMGLLLSGTIALR